jgi:hypothetical protein
MINKHIKKYLKNIILLSAIQLSSMCSYADEVNYNDYRDIHKYVANEAKGLMRQYSNIKPLDAEIFDSTDESIKGFIQGTSQSKADHLLAVQYFPKLGVNGKDMSFCFLFYDSKKNIFQQYKNVGKMSDEEILQYLTWHEMGHCFAKHENFNINPKTNEFIADAFAISVAMNEQKNKLPIKIIKLVDSLNSNDIHANKPQLEKFLLSILERNIFSKSLTVNEIINLIRYFHEYSSLDGYK